LDPAEDDGHFFRRKGSDLWWHEVLSLREAWLGGWTRTLTHLDGHRVRLGRAKGETVYKERCTSCHVGREADGRFVTHEMYAAGHPPLPPLEILKTIACFRFILPRQEIKIAGGRTVNLRDLQSLIFMAGASALMVGNYLTTLNQPVEKDLQMIKDLGLDPCWDKHGFSDQDAAVESLACG
jgi:hypothetical protein